MTCSSFSTVSKLFKFLLIEIECTCMDNLKKTILRNKYKKTYKHNITKSRKNIITLKKLILFLNYFIKLK